jgi:hypothetical protein
MAFLDNSGDIILDAVLTETGRKLLSSGGGIRISKFALGDDEINYGLFDKNHPSGSAYYDLEILQTPVFEAVSQINANINYGLLTFTNKNIIYMPEFVQNTKDNAGNFATPHQKLYYLAVNEETATTLEAAGAIFGSSPQKVIRAGSKNTRAITYELGINSSEISKNSTTKAQYITNLGMNDSQFSVSVNGLFLDLVMGLGSSGDTYENELNDNTLVSVPSSERFANARGGGPSKNRSNYRDFRVRGAQNNIFEPNGASTTASTFSVISGPGSRLVMLNFGVAAGLQHTKDGTRDRKYTQYGKVGQTAKQTFGSAIGSETYDFIDTTVYLSANTTGAQISIPVRIVRRAS